MDGYERQLLIDQYHSFIPDSMMIPHREGGMEQRSWNPKKRKKKTKGSKKSSSRTRTLHAAQNGRCFYCDKPVSITGATKDHMVPKSKGGSDSMTNLVMACRGCNTAKGDMSKDEFLRARGQ